MRFLLQITFTEEDYISAQLFDQRETRSAKKKIMKSRMLFLVFAVWLTVMAYFLLGASYLIYFIAFLTTYFVSRYILFLDEGLKRFLKESVEHWKKRGRIPEDSRIEFYDDKMVSVSALVRTERAFQSIERICVVKDRFILLYNDSGGMSILPYGQVAAQVDMGAFLQFLTEKCGAPECY